VQSVSRHEQAPPSGRLSDPGRSQLALAGLDRRAPATDRRML